MDDTGRIKEALDWRARRIIFGSNADGAIEQEVPFHLQIDRAHVVTLLEAGILSPQSGRRLLAAMRDLAARDYAPLRGRPAPRGLYLLYEHYLVETLGEQAVGALHIGRSRNDINATILRLRLRRPWCCLVRQVLRLLAVLIRRAERHTALTMPIYTHYQAALPVTYGHYLSGVALALLRDLQGIVDAVVDMDRCPLGGGAGAGTTVPIDTLRTARILGFRKGALHSVDAVASRDLVLRLLGALTVLGVTLSRLSTDLQLWSTAEFDLVRFPDRLIGSSSMMPQKRNAFLLEHIKGRSGAPLGAFTAAAVAMHSTPFSNSIAVGTEGVKHLWNALDALTESTVLARLVVAGAEPQAGNMRRRAIEGFTQATELANRLVLEGGLPFRRAHYATGEAVTGAIESRVPLEAYAGLLCDEHDVSPEPGWLDPAAIAARTAHGGGPAETSLQNILAALKDGWAEGVRRLKEQSRIWREGEFCLDHAVAAVLARELPPLVPERPECA